MGTFSGALFILYSISFAYLISALFSLFMYSEMVGSTHKDIVCNVHYFGKCKERDNFSKGFQI